MCVLSFSPCLLLLGRADTKKNSMSRKAGKAPREEDYEAVPITESDAECEPFIGEVAMRMILSAVIDTEWRHSTTPSAFWLYSSSSSSGEVSIW